MLIWLACALFGHKTVIQQFSRKFELAPDNVLGGEYPVFFYKLVRVPFCTRCGTRVHDDGVEASIGELP